MKRARIVLHYEDGSWWAESPDLEGFTVVAQTLRELQSAVREAVAFHLKSNDPVEISESLAAAQPAAEVSWVSRTGGQGSPRVRTRVPQARFATKVPA